MAKLSPQLAQYAGVLVLMALRNPMPPSTMGKEPMLFTSAPSNGICCEGDGDVVGVVTPLVRGGAQVLHGDQVVELSVLLEVHEREEKGEDGEGQIEVEDERGELKERRTCTWMT